MNQYEKLIELIINEQEDQARELFHQIVVEKSREIYENLIDENDFDEGVHGSGNQVEELVQDIEIDQQGLPEAEAEDDEMDMSMSDETGDDEGDDDGDGCQVTTTTEAPTTTTEAPTTTTTIAPTTTTAAPITAAFTSETSKVDGRPGAFPVRRGEVDTEASPLPAAGDPGRRISS
jgi:hypothetical protein